MFHNFSVGFAPPAGRIFSFVFHWIIARVTVFKDLHQFEYKKCAKWKIARVCHFSESSTLYALIVPSFFYFSSKFAESIRTSPPIICEFLFIVLSNSMLSTCIHSSSFFLIFCHPVISASLCYILSLSVTAFVTAMRYQFLYILGSVSFNKSIQID